MRYLCLGYMDELRWQALSAEKRKEAIALRRAYEELLRQRRQIVGAESLDSASSAVTLRNHEGLVQLCDGPHGSAGEHLADLLVLEARDLNHAIQLVSQHPALRHGGIFEIRPSTPSQPAGLPPMNSTPLPATAGASTERSR